MLVVTLTWTEPTDGTHAILFPDGAEEEIAELDEYLRELHGSEYGETIARLGWHRKKGDATDEDPWGDLALNVRYTTGEELYEEECPIFARRGIARQ